MEGIINWNELWKIMRSRSPWRRTLDEPAGSFWDKRAKQFNESMMQNRERAEKQMAKIVLNPEYTVLDVGAGTGRLAIPVAKQVKSVTAIDPSRGMLACLQENMEKEEVENITCINKRWEDIELGADIEPHDVVIASHSLAMLDIQDALAKIDAAAKRCVYLYTFAGRWMDGGLWEKIHGETRPSWSDYIYLCNILHDMKIYANVDVWDSEFEQRYGSLDEAVTKLKEMYDMPSEKERILREHLSKILVEDDGTLCLKRKSKSAMIWWKKNAHE
ncbi:class I SAM-dependent methyltransferase [Methanophagales archaeon]|nr:MAG: class I SAM-dependent methyltransferase [Methanophagales archaeon]